MSVHDKLRVQITACLEQFLDEVIKTSCIETDVPIGGVECEPCRVLPPEWDVAIAMDTSAPFFVNLILALVYKDNYERSAEDGDS